MKWKAQQLHDRRLVRRFAWFPVESNDGYVYWLEHYYSCETFNRDYNGSWWARDYITQDHNAALNWIHPEYTT
jgi:hypothetical protein